MTKPAVTLYNTKGSPLTTSELDTNFANLRDSTIGFTVGSNTANIDLNSALTVTAGTGISLSLNTSTNTLQITGTVGATYDVSAVVNGYASVQLNGSNGSTDYVAFRGLSIANQYISTSVVDSGTIAIDWDRNTFVNDLFTEETSPLTGGQTINHRQFKRCYVPTSNHVISTNSTVTPTLGTTPGMWRVYDLRANITQFNVPSDMEDGMEAMYVFYQNNILGTGNYSVTFNGYLFRDGTNTISIVPGSLTIMTVRRVTVYGTARYMAEIKKDYT